jgi:hypothetical protein
MDNKEIYITNTLPGWFKIVKSRNLQFSKETEKGIKSPPPQSGNHLKSCHLEK